MHFAFWLEGVYQLFSFYFFYCLSCCPGAHWVQAGGSFVGGAAYWLEVVSSIGVSFAIPYASCFHSFLVGFAYILLRVLLSVCCVGLLGINSVFPIPVLCLGFHGLLLWMWLSSGIFWVVGFQVGRLALAGL